MTRIGLIVATDGKLWNGEKEYGKHFIGKFQKFNDDETVKYDLFYAFSGLLPKKADFHKYSGFAISGSHFSCNDPFVWITNLVNFVLDVHEYNKTKENGHAVNLFGICFGHQLIAKAFGGVVAVTRHKKKFVFNCEQVEFTEDMYQKQWYEQIFGHRKDINIIQLHGDEVAVLPGNATRVARSKSCINEACLYDGGRIFSVQGHPEDLLEDVRDVKGPYLLKANRIKRSDYNDIVEKCSKDLDTALLMQMAVKFLTH